MKFILASSNAHKASEFATLFKNNIEIDCAPSALDVDETGESFFENSFLKAKAYFEKFKSPTMADDSGLIIVERPNLLGVQTANYAPEFKEYRQRCEKLLNEISGLAYEKRQAYFVCVLCFYVSHDEHYFFEGRVHGTIGQSYRGENGFGYDPIFIPDRAENDAKTLAELPDWKDQNSHRAKAVQGALKFFSK
jgi:XTP/dITP diphosphohydrolase